MADREEILADFQVLASMLVLFFFMVFYLSVGYCVLQACTGIEDVGEAFMHLEETNWNLMVSLWPPYTIHNSECFFPLQEAVYRVLPHGSQELPAARAPDPPVEIMEELGASAMSLDLEPALPSVSTLPYQTPQLVSLSNDFMSGRGRGARTLNFTINYGESRIELKVKQKSSFHQWACISSVKSLHS